MQHVDLQRALDRVAQALVETRAGVALTGAGLSVPSGVPDFRSPGGLWERYDPMKDGSIGAFRGDPARAWRMLAEQEESVRKASPNAGHTALAELERLGVLYGIITQNVDGLHQEAGSACVVEFHGSFRRLRCLSCDAYYDTAQRADLGMPPTCRCSHVLKPDVVLFGETIPKDAVVGATQLVRTCAVMLVVGTSATVQPVAMYPDLAEAGGALVVEFNVAPTELTTWCEITILGDASETLPMLVQSVRAQS